MKKIVAAFLTVYAHSLYAQDVTTGLVGHYTFEGTSNDVSGKGNHGTLDGRYQFVAGGVVGRGLQLLGDNSLIYVNGGHMVLPEFGTIMNSGFTVSFWVRDEVLGSYPTGEQSYISLGIGDRPAIGILTDNRRILFFSNNGIRGGPSFDITKQLEFPADIARWKHLVVAYTPGRIAAYFNGVKVGEGAVTVNAFPTGRTALGRSWWGEFGASAARMTALYDNLRLYSRALSDADVRQLHILDQLSEATTVPSIVTPPSAKTVVVGQGASFTVVAGGTGTLAFQWSINNVPILGATSSTLTIGSVQEADAGSYTVTVTNTLGAATTAPVSLLVQAAPKPGKLINIATRGMAGVGDGALIAGFSLSGEAPVRVLIRGVGPTLLQFGVSGVLTDPRVTVFQGARVLASNDNWGTAGSVEIVRASSEVGAFILTDPRDSALIITLPAGSYTANVSGSDATAGIVLLEVYELP